jgi:hypothetical protein
LLIIGGSPVLPIILLVVMAAVAFGRRDRTLSMLLGK